MLCHKKTAGRAGDGGQATRRRPSRTAGCEEKRERKKEGMTTKLLKGKQKKGRGVRPLQRSSFFSAENRREGIRF